MLSTTDFNYATGSQVGVKKEFKKDYTKTVKGKKVTEKFRVRQYESMTLYCSRRAWMTGRIWEFEMRKLDRHLGKKGRRILLLLDNCSAHKAIPCRNIEFLFLMLGCTPTLQVS